MNIRDCIQVALRNIKANWDIIKKMVIGESVIIILFVCFIAVYDSYLEYQDEYSNKKMADCYIFTMNDNSDSQLKEKNPDEIMRMMLVKNKEIGQITAQQFRILINAKEYGVRKYSFASYNYVQNINRLDSIVDVQLGYEKGYILPKCFGKKEQDFFMYGRYCSNQGEVILDEYLLEIIGCTDDYSNLIGKKVSIDGLFDNYTLVGIYSSEVLKLRETLSGFNHYLTHICVNPTEKDSKNLEICNVESRGYYKTYDALLENIDSLDSILKMDYNKIFHAGDTDSIAITKIAMEYCVIYWCMISIGRLLVVLGIFISIILLLNIWYLFGFYFDRTKNYYSMLRCIGMTKNDRMKIMLLDVNVSYFIAGVCASYFSLFFILLLRVLFKSVFQLAISISVMPFAMGILITLILINFCTVGYYIKK